MSMSLGLTTRAWQPPALITALLITCATLALAAVRWPWIVSGVVFGLLLLLLIVTRPLLLVALMLALGPADLSFMTGGFKALFTEAGGLDMNGIRLLGVSFGFCLLLAHKSVQGAAFSKHNRWYIAFLIWAAASLITSYSVVEGLRLLLKIAYPFLMFVVVAGMVQNEDELDKLMLWTLGAALLIILINPLMLFGFAYQVDEEGYKRIGGLGTYANPFSFYLMVILFISLARFVVRRQLRYLVLCLVLGIWIYLTLTRITLLGVAAGVAVMGVYAALAQRSYRALITTFLVATVVIGPFVPVVLERSLGFVPTPGELAAVIASPLQLYESMNWEGREFIWPVVLHSFAGDRWTGLGLGSSTVVLRANMPASVGYVVHNEYLRLASEVGLIGCALYFLAVWRWLILTWRTGWRASDRTREFAYAGLAAITGWAIVALTDNPFDYYAPLTQYVGFLCAATLVSARLSTRPVSGAAA